MALVGPVLVHDTTNTSGTGSLSLNNATSDGRRGLADAVTNGDAANGDTCYYVVEQSTTSGSSLVFEAGLGTISDSGATLSRDSVIQSSNSGNKVSLPGGGTYDVRIVVLTESLLQAANNLSDVANADTAADNLGAARLNAANSFQQSLTVDVTGAVGRVTAGSDISTATATAGGLRILGHDSGGNNQIYVQLIGIIDDPTDGSEDGHAELQVVVNGSLATVAEFDEDAVAIDNLQTTAGKKYDALETGTELMFGGTIPTGWTRNNANQSRVPRLAKTGETIGATGGTSDIFGSWATLGHPLVLSEIPPHDHTYNISNTTSGSNVIFTWWADGDQPSQSATTGSSGGGGAHTHNMATPYYEIWAAATKD